jgi:murein DD-endopeptidase MepM/ murein hydrolase activator NlpD
MNIKFCHLIILAIFSFSACRQKPAPILNYGKGSGYNKQKYAKKTKSENSQIEVAQGDTPYSIAKKYHVEVRSLIEQNNLVAPYNLKVGMKLTIPIATAPSYHDVKSGDTLYSISRNYGMNIDDLVAINELKSPYELKVGQKIKVTKSAESNNKKTVEVSKVEQEKPSQNIIEKIIDNKSNKFSWPIEGAIISKFGPKKGGLYNDGINIKAKEGMPVKAAEDGVVAYVGNELRGYGNLIIVKHSGGWITAYAHLSKATVKRGEKVKKLQTIAAVGATGNVDSPQLYFGLRKARDAVNPEVYLRR